MKVITLWQPWASFIDWKWKTIETRMHDRFKNLVGETIGIHAGNTWDKDWKELAEEYLTQMQIDEIGILRNVFDEGLEKSQILCTTKIDDAGWINSIHSHRALINCNFVEYKFMRYGLFLTDIRTIKRIEVKGHQGIWNYDGEIIYL